MAGLFGNRFDTMSLLNNRLIEESMAAGQLSSYGSGQMAAYQEGRMGNPFSAAVNDLMSPEMQKQKILDELQEKHPNPDTPEKLMALAEDLSMNGFGDMAQKVRIEASNLTSATATKLKASRPSKDLLDQISFGLTSAVLSPQFVDDYFQRTNPTYYNKYNSLTEDAKTGAFTATQYANKRDAAKRVLENQFKNFRNFVSRQKGMGINEINSLLSNEVLLTEAFKEWAKKHTSNDFSKFLDERMIVGEVGGTSLNPGDENLDNTSNTFKNVSLLSEEAAKKKIDAYKKMDKNLFTPFQVEEFDALQQVFPQLVSASAFNNPQTQQWFEINFDAGQRYV
jgi:hypothetical protein